MILIIGAGVAGLAAGCYAQMNGYRRRSSSCTICPAVCAPPGSARSTSSTAASTICLAPPGQPFYQVWQELGALQGRRMINHEEFMRVSLRMGALSSRYCDPDRLETHMKELSPEDAALIEELAQGVRHFHASICPHLCSQAPLADGRRGRERAWARNAALPARPWRNWGLLSARISPPASKTPSCAAPSRRCSPGQKSP